MANARLTWRNDRAFYNEMIQIIEDAFVDFACEHGRPPKVNVKLDLLVLPRERREITE